MKSTSRFPFYIPIIILSLTSCRPEQKAEKDHEMDMGQQDHMSSATGIVVAQSSKETLAMIDSVQKAQAAVDPSKVNIILCAQRAQLYKSKLASVSGLEKANLMVMYGFEELKAGNTQQAMDAFRDVITFVTPMQIPGKEKTILEVKKMLAIAALRLGEQQNCISNHTSASCVIPIAKAGQHTLKDGSTEAMELYTEVLKEDPEDLTSKYLLNIAAMTLGKFPDGIPASMRMPERYFKSKIDFPMFTDIAPEIGLDKRGLAGGVAVEDFDRDGDLDVIASSWGFHDQIRYLRNKGDGSFEDVTAQSGLQGVTGGLNLRHADYNNDGYADVLVLRGAWLRDQGRIPNSLLRNNGDGTFTDVTLSSGIYSKCPTQNAIWEDFDLDGWLDLFIGNESIPELGSAFNFPSEFYHNQHDGTFKEMAADAGLNINSFVKGSTGGDINNDGLPDLFISNLNGANMLFLNTSDKTGIHFQNISGTAGIGEPYVSFPTWMFDYNNDGWLDIFVSAYSDGSEDLPGKVLRAYGKKDDPFRPRLYRNNGNNTFTDMSSEMGLTEPAFTMGCNYGDLNNDGYPDFYLGTGEPNLKSIVPNKMYLNREGKYFDDVTYSGGFGNIQKGHAVGFGDFDKDGDQDIYVVMGGSFEGDIYETIFFENPMPHDNNWVILRLEGVNSNRSAIGARVEVDIIENGKPRKIYEMVSTGASFGGNSLQVELGLGKAEEITNLKVMWPNSNKDVQEFQHVVINKAYTLKEGGQLVTVDYQYVAFKKDGMHHQHAM
ncbi:MAG: CRTAC1 family protein [Saprospiraceae bacterium]